MVGYSSYSSRENYYADYVSYLLNLEQQDRIDKFNGFNFNDTFGNGVWEKRFDKLAEFIKEVVTTALIDKKQKAFSSWIEADYWLFGAIYYILFKGWSINMPELKKAHLVKKILNKKDDITYSRTPNQLKNLRDRMEESILFFEKISIPSEQ